MNLAQKYRKSLDERWCLRLKTVLPDGDNYDGIVTHNKRQFVVLRNVRDFRFDGVILLPKRIIKSYRDNKYEKCCNAIIRENENINKMKVPPWMDSCDSIADVLAQFQRRDIWPIIETLVDDGADTSFYLGPITDVNEKTFHLKCYDAAGKWEGIYELSYHDVCRIEFDSAYCNDFNAYMRSQKTPDN